MMVVAHQFRDESNVARKHRNSVTVIVIVVVDVDVDGFS